MTVLFTAAGTEKMLLAALQSATNMVKTASNAKYETIAAINEHTKLLKEVVDAGDVSFYGSCAKLSSVDTVCFPFCRVETGVS